MLRAGEELVHGGALDDAPGVHHGHFVAQFGDNPKVVRDQDDRGVDLGPQIAHQFENLRLGRYVECGGGLVRDQKARAVEQRHRDHHALAHAARQLHRVRPQAVFGAGDTDSGEALDRHPPRLGLRHLLVQAHGLDQLPSDRHHRIERGHRILEDHRHVVTAQRSQLAGGQADQLPLAKANAALDRRALREQAHDRQTHRRLAAARLADDAEHLARVDGQAHAIDGTDRAIIGPEGRAQVLDGEQCHTSTPAGSADRGRH